MNKLASKFNQLTAKIARANVLDAPWTSEVYQKCKSHHFRELPVVSSYPKLDPSLLTEFDSLEKELSKEGTNLSQVLLNSLRTNRLAFLMLNSAGSQEFASKSNQIYGSSKDYLQKATEYKRRLDSSLIEIIEKTYSAETASKILNNRLATYFSNPDVSCETSDSLNSDAAVAGTTIKLRSTAKFSRQDIDLLEAHEAWVHIGTRLNGALQPEASWLQFETAHTTVTQEGLAVFFEILSRRSFHARAIRVPNYVIATSKIEDGADFIDIFNWFYLQGYDREDCYLTTQRLFQGVPLTGGYANSRDLCYFAGLLEISAFVHDCLFSSQRQDQIPLLFLGRLNVQDMPLLANSFSARELEAPKYVPAILKHMQNLSLFFLLNDWMPR